MTLKDVTRRGESRTTTSPDRTAEAAGTRTPTTLTPSSESAGPSTQGAAAQGWGAVDEWCLRQLTSTRLPPGPIVERFRAMVAQGYDPAHLTVTARGNVIFDPMKAETRTSRGQPDIGEG